MEGEDVIITMEGEDDSTCNDAPSQTLSLSESRRNCLFELQLCCSMHCCTVVAL
jgi:hypothetical protein